MSTTTPRRVSAKITYAKPGTQPPIYVAGSFSSPPWHPEEMAYTTESAEHEFFKEISVEEGTQHQYKFRIGTGDWWVLNEEAPTGTDDLGNRNNLLSIPVTGKPVEADPSTMESSDAEQPHADIPIPTLVVEKTGEEPSHGDDFGPEATTGQKEAYEMRSQDAEPDVTIINPDTSTTEPATDINEHTDNNATSADDAAEVADSAATLDREASPAPVSNEEAGRTGFRRMSGTPIPEVAITASAVADSAAIIDKETIGTIEMPKPFQYKDSVKLPSGTITPVEDEAPRLPHECLGEYASEQPPPGTLTPNEERAPLLPHEKPESPTKATSEPSYDNSPTSPVFEDVDVNDPNLEEFPSDRESILAHVRRASTRLNVDEVINGSDVSSPVASLRRHSGSVESLPVSLQPSPSLSLHKIAEEFDEPTDGLTLPDNASDSTEPEIIDVHGTSSGDIVVQPLATEKNLDGKDESVNAESAADDSKRHTSERINDTVLSSEGVPSLGDRNVAVDGAKSSGVSTHEDEDTPAVRDEDYAALEGATGGNKSTGGKAPGIFVQPATPSTEPSNVAEFADGEAPKEDMKPTSNELIGKSELRNRKTPAERPVTPRTAESPLKSPEQAVGFFRAIWRSVFVEWIGGMISRICGSRSRA